MLDDLNRLLVAVAWVLLAILAGAGLPVFREGA